MTMLLGVAGLDSQAVRATFGTGWSAAARRATGPGERGRGLERRLATDALTGDVPERDGGPPRRAARPVGLGRWIGDAVAGAIEPRDRHAVGPQHPRVRIDAGPTLGLQRPCPEQDAVVRARVL